MIGNFFHSIAGYCGKEGRGFHALRLGCGIGDLPFAARVSYPRDGRRFSLPHAHIASRMGMSVMPRSVRLYSTFGGI